MGLINEDKLLGLHLTRKCLPCDMQFFALRPYSLSFFVTHFGLLQDLPLSSKAENNESSLSRDRGSYLRLLPAAPLHYAIVLRRYSL